MWNGTTDGEVAAERVAVGHEPTVIDRAAVQALYGTILPPGTKGMPLAGEGLTLGCVARSGWNVLGGELPMPVMVLKESALRTNLAAMAAYCRTQGVALCPHGKTTMAPQLFQRQIDAGAWGLTAATPTHLRLYRRFGVQRILYANQLVEPVVIAWLADELERSKEFDFYCLVDSIDGVRRLDAGLPGKAASIRVLIEVGFPGGRCGVRSRDDAREVAAAVDAAASLELAGIECFEGLVARDGTASSLATVDQFLAFVRSVASDLLLQSSLGDLPEVLLSGGGSAYFDRVVSAFADGRVGRSSRVILRSGCYLTQDGGFYAQTSPLAGRRDGPPALTEAIEIWSTVLSRPEPGLAITSMGRRDAPQDQGLPVPTAVAAGQDRPVALRGSSVIALSDQHAHVSVDQSCQLGPGDLLGCSISHPCTAFDRWRVIPVVDDDYVVRDAVLTFF